MAKCLVIGGGLSGLSSAVYLSQSGHKATLIESSPKLGGRAYAFKYKDKGFVDNGQHVLMGSCKQTLDYLRTINNIDKLNIQSNLSINVRKKGGESYKLESIGRIYPFNLIFGLLNYNPISIWQRIKIILKISSLLSINKSKLELLSSKEWLKDNRIIRGEFSSFWDLIINATMNTTPENASASIFTNLLKEVFLKGSFASSILVPATDLTSLFCLKAMEFIEQNSGRVLLSEKVTKMEFEGDIVTGIHTNKGFYENFDFVVSGLPFYSLNKISLDLSHHLSHITFNYSPIVTTHIWLRNNPFLENYYGLIDSNMHWLFNHGNYVTTVTSSADELVELGVDEIEKIALSELQLYFPEFNPNLVTEVRVIKEKRATFIPDAETEQMRKKIPGNIGNLFIAGDWTDTGFPGTIEGAIKSGKKAADSISAF